MLVSGTMAIGVIEMNRWPSVNSTVDVILTTTEAGALAARQTTQTIPVVANLKAAKALGITIPESILLRADEVIR